MNSAAESLEMLHRARSLLTEVQSNLEGDLTKQVQRSRSNTPNPESNLNHANLNYRQVLHTSMAQSDSLANLKNEIGDSAGLTEVNSEMAASKNRSLSQTHSITSFIDSASRVHGPGHNFTDNISNVSLNSLSDQDNTNSLNASLSLSDHSPSPSLSPDENMNSDPERTSSSFIKNTGHSLNQQLQHNQSDSARVKSSFDGDYGEAGGEESQFETGMTNGNGGPEVINTGRNRQECMEICENEFTSEAQAARRLRHSAEERRGMGADKDDADDRYDKDIDNRRNNTFDKGSRMLDRVTTFRDRATTMTASGKGQKECEQHCKTTYPNFYDNIPCLACFGGGKANSIMCFSGDTEVVVQHGSDQQFCQCFSKPLSQVKIGDKVLVCDTVQSDSVEDGKPCPELSLRFEPIITWLHRQTSCVTVYVEIQLDIGSDDEVTDLGIESLASGQCSSNTKTRQSHPEKRFINMKSNKGISSDYIINDFKKNQGLGHDFLPVVSETDVVQKSYSDSESFYSKRDQNFDLTKSIRIHSMSKSSLKLTPHHMLFSVSRGKYIESKDVYQGEMVYMLDSKISNKSTTHSESQTLTTRLVRVSKVSLCIGNCGIFAPLTASGTIIASNVLCSCYSMVSAKQMPIVSCLPTQFLEDVSGGKHEFFHYLFMPLIKWRLNVWRAESGNENTFYCGDNKSIKDVESDTESTNKMEEGMDPILQMIGDPMGDERWLDVTLLKKWLYEILQVSDLGDELGQKQPLKFRLRDNVQIYSNEDSPDDYDM